MASSLIAGRMGLSLLQDKRRGMGGSLFTRLPRTNIQSYQLILLNLLQWLVSRKFLFTVHPTELIPSLRCPTQQLYAYTVLTVDPFKQLTPPSPYHTRLPKKARAAPAGHAGEFCRRKMEDRIQGLVCFLAFTSVACLPCNLVNGVEKGSGEAPRKEAAKEAAALEALNNLRVPVA